MKIHIDADNFLQNEKANEALKRVNAFSAGIYKRLCRTHQE